MSALRPLVTTAVLLILAASVFSRAAQADAVLTVEQVNGQVHIDHLGETRLLQAGDELHDRDVVRVDEGAYLSLRFTAEGALELGPGAALAIERLPANAKVTDLRSIFSLWKGYMHVVWRRPAATRWPLFVYFGGQRSSLVDGEYFFERDGDRIRSCVAAGYLAVTAISGDGLETLRPSACYESRTGSPMKTQVRSLESWVAVRQSFTLEPDPAKPVHAFAAPEPDAPPAEPLIAAAAVASPVPGPAAPPPTSIIFTARKTPPAAAPSAPTPAVPKAAAPPSVSPSAAPSSASAPVSEGSPGWTILIGSYADPQNALQVQQRLSSIGLTPFMRVKTIDGRVWNSVQVRGFATREAAEAKMADATTKLGLPNLRVVQLQ